MKILCFGAGAIGSYIGGSLALIGNPLTFIERREYLPSLTENGIRIEDIHGEEHHLTRFNAYASADEALNNQSFDLAIMAVKGFDTDALLQSLKPLATFLPPFLSLQNGVENEQKIAEVVGADKVISASVCTAISRGAQGAIKVEKLRGIGLADGFPLSTELCRECAEAGLKPQLIKDAKAMKWSKLISNLLANASSAILDMTPAEIFSDPLSFDLEIRQMRETLAVMKAWGIHPINIPGVPVRALCFAVEKLPGSISRPFLIKAVGSGRGGKMPSFYIDLHAGKKQSEVEYLNGAVVRFGEGRNIPVPVNQAYYQILSAMAAGTLPLDSYRRNPQKLRETIENNNRNK